MGLMSDIVVGSVLGGICGYSYALCCVATAIKPVHHIVRGKMICTIVGTVVGAGVSLVY